MLPGRTVAARFIKRDEAEELRQNERLKRFASLRAAQHRGHLRRYQRTLARTGRTSRARTCRSCHREHVESPAQGKGVRRLEPERRTQDDRLCLFAARQGIAYRFNPCQLGRSRKLPQKEKSRSP